MIALSTYTTTPQWKDFFSLKDAKALENLIEEKWIPSAGTFIHLDIYRQDAHAPTVVYCHGLATCGRIMGHIALGLYNKGYNVICPDLWGFGLSTQRHGSGTIALFINNLISTISFAKTLSDGPRFLAGISLGGILSYYTACVCDDIKAIACYCLLDLSARRTKKISQDGKHITLMTALAKLGSLVVPNVYTPVRKFLSIDRLSQNKEFNQLFVDNPLCVKRYTFKSACSIISTAPHIPFERFTKMPVMVLHGENDRLIPESLSRMNYEKLACPKKYHCIKGCEHAPVEVKHLNEYVTTMDEWFLTPFPQTKN
ncbi:MAG: alpha/beta fold hydrolase [Deltaproteobacteria bacterium]|nr:alpha/beta fold hydrolase [Deltaproteobacteria bacterium]